MAQNKLPVLLEELETQMSEQLTHYQNELYPRLAQLRTLPPSDAQSACEEAQSEIQQIKTTIPKLQRAYYETIKRADELETRFKEGKKGATHCRFSLRPPANSVVDYEETSKQHFARGLNFYKIALIIILGSFLGVVVELLWCFLKNGYLESRSGLVYGPFNLLYGIGSLLLSVTLYRFRNRSSLWSFTGGMLVGSALEYACSFWQEWMFGSVSWDYSDMPFNLNGRICLLYSVFWGFLGVFWIKIAYPFFAYLILKLPNRSGKVITVALSLFMVLNCIVSFAAMSRWVSRLDGKPANSIIDTVLDQRFPNGRMERIYANLDFINHPKGSAHSDSADF